MLRSLFKTKLKVIPDQKDLSAVFASDIDKDDICLPLKPSFRFLTEPVSSNESHSLIGRSDQVDSFAKRILFSNGGSFLLTGYRGVGKTSFINQVVNRIEEIASELQDIFGKTKVLRITLNLTRPVTSAELMHYIVRNLYTCLVDSEVFDRLTDHVRQEITLAYLRTSSNIARKHSESFEKSYGFNEASVGNDLLKAALKVSLQHKKSGSENHELSFLGYDDRSAEYDIVNISRKLSKGFPEKLSWFDQAKARFGYAKKHSIGIRVIFIFDELDKLTSADSTMEKYSLSNIDQVISSLKSVFTTTGISFVFIAGMDMEDQWQKDVRAGDSIYESVFAYSQYLPCLWSDLSLICDYVVDWSAVKTQADKDGLHQLFENFKKYLSFKGRGIPRSAIRTLNSHVKWKGASPYLAFSPHELNALEFYAVLQSLLLKSEKRLFGKLANAIATSDTDRKHLSIYYIIDWILAQGSLKFNFAAALYASKQLSSQIAPAEEIAPELLQQILVLLLENEFLMVASEDLAETMVGPINDSRVFYKLSPKCLKQLLDFKESITDTTIFTRPLPNSVTIPKEPSYSGLPIATKYGIVSLLGQGGLSRVYKAVNLESGKTVVVKTFLGRDLSSTPIDLEDVYSNVITFVHPNVLPHFEVIKESENLSVVMKYVEGKDLAFALSNQEFSLANAKRVGLCVAKAIEYIHDKGFVRLDVKPNNVMLAYDENIYLTDFDTMIRNESKPDTEIPIAGTPFYMAPEIFNGQVSETSDIYSFGVLLYQMVTGRLPYDASDVGGLIKLKTIRPLPASTYQRIPDKLNMMIMRCLEPDPADRFQSIGPVIEMLSTSR